MNSEKYKIYEYIANYVGIHNLNEYISYKKIPLNYLGYIYLANKNNTNIETELIKDINYEDIFSTTAVFIIELILNLEKEYDINISDDESVDNLHDLVDLFYNKLNMH